MTRQMFIDFVTKKIENQIKDSRDIYDNFCRTLIMDPKKVESWIKENMEGWKIFAIMETGKDVRYFNDWDMDLLVKKFIGNFKKVFLKLKLVKI